MFQMNETEKTTPAPIKKENSIENATAMSFESIEHFNKWLDVELEQLTEKYADFATDKSIGKFFQRS